MTGDLVVIDSGGANLASLCFALERLGATPTVTAEAACIERAAHVILPGVGAAGDSMQRLRAAGLDVVIRGLRIPLLGICLGMQLLFDHSAEGDTACLGVIPGRVEALVGSIDRPVPHMGWNTLTPCGTDPLLAQLRSGEYAYFVHSYAAPVGPHTIATTAYGAPLSAIVRRENFYGVQYHPERSGADGARLLQRFLSLRACA